MNLSPSCMNFTWFFVIMISYDNTKWPSKYPMEHSRPNMSSTKFQAKYSLLHLWNFVSNFKQQAETFFILFLYQGFATRWMCVGTFAVKICYIHILLKWFIINREVIIACAHHSDFKPKVNSYPAAKQSCFPCNILPRLPSLDNTVAQYHLQL